MHCGWLSSITSQSQQGPIAFSSPFPSLLLSFFSLSTELEVLCHCMVEVQHRVNYNESIILSGLLLINILTFRGSRIISIWPLLGKNDIVMLYIDIDLFFLAITWCNFFSPKSCFVFTFHCYFIDENVNTTLDNCKITKVPQTLIESQCRKMLWPHIYIYINRGLNIHLTREQH